MRQAEIAERFEVSTTPVREAFASLASEGLVRQDAHRGAVVFVPSKDDLVQNYEIRLALEPLATRIAATEATLEDLEKLAHLLEEMRGPLVGDTPRHGAELNARFHATIYNATRRPRLAELIQQLRDAAAAYVQLLTLKPQPMKYIEGAHAEHQEIVDALRARAPEEAAGAMTRHLVHNRDQMLAMMEADTTT